jgi:hypothetical protein
MKQPKEDIPYHLQKKTPASRSFRIYLMRVYRVKYIFLREYNS